MAPIQSTEHIPAWKRLGLKLKSAPLENQAILEPIASEQLPNRPSTPDLKTKRQRDESYSKEGPPSKKVKKVKPFKSALSPPPPQSPALKKQKSVSFTPETKRDDGDSIKQLFNAWVDQQKQEDPNFATKRSIAAFKIPEPPKVIEQVEDTTLTESEKRVKRVKKAEKPQKIEKIKKVKETSNPTEAPTRLSPALSYLREYHDSRSTWKFNKNHQIFIIKHIFDITKIPLDHTHLLHHYITGMQGNVRTRLRDEALKVKIQDQEAGAEAFPSTMSDPERRQQEYMGAMSEYIATVTMQEAHPPMGYEEGVASTMSDLAMRERLGKRMRAERILVQLSREPQNGELVNGGSASEVFDGDSQKRMRLNDGSSQKTARKRKLRTAADIDDDEDDTSSSGTSSEEDSSSDSSSSSDSDDSSEDEDGGVSITIRRGNGDDTSSSSDSSSSSSSDDDSDESDESDEEE